PEVGRFDSHRGLVLLGAGNRTFEALNAAQSGFWWEGQVRDLLWLDTKEKRGKLLVARNDESVLTYQLRKDYP
ncbi:MAG: hypothetical protein AAFQ68_12590, partial [Bacteroidota bacterium]